jgi:hypothetical protein
MFFLLWVALSWQTTCANKNRFEYIVRGEINKKRMDLIAFLKGRLYLENNVADVSRIPVEGLQESQSLSVQPEELPVLREHGVQLDLGLWVAHYR